MLVPPCPHTKLHSSSPSKATPGWRSGPSRRGQAGAKGQGGPADPGVSATHSPLPLLGEALEAQSSHPALEASSDPNPSRAPGAWSTYSFGVRCPGQRHTAPRREWGAAPALPVPASPTPSGRRPAPTRSPKGSPRPRTASPDTTSPGERAAGAAAGCRASPPALRPTP